MKTLEDVAKLISKNPNITTLDLSNKHLGDLKEGEINKLFSIIGQAKNLHTLNLASNYLSDWKMFDILDIRNANVENNASSITTLGLSDNFLGLLAPAQLNAFAYIFSFVPNLTFVDFGNNELVNWDIECIRAFAELIKSIPNLNKLWMSNNDIAEWDTYRIQAFGAALAQADKLTTLSISDMSIDEWPDDDFNIFITELAKSTSLETIHCHGLYEDRIQQLQKITDRNKANKKVDSKEKDEASLANTELLTAFKKPKDAPTFTSTSNASVSDTADNRHEEENKNKKDIRPDRS